MPDAKDDAASNENPKKQEEQKRKDERDADKARQSRRFMSASVEIPAFLREAYPIDDDITIVHVTHKTHVLPHFQCRLPHGQQHEGKLLC